MGASLSWLGPVSQRLARFEGIGQTLHGSPSQRRRQAITCIQAQPLPQRIGGVFDAAAQEERDINNRVSGLMERCRPLVAGKDLGISAPRLSFLVRLCQHLNPIFDLYFRFRPSPLTSRFRTPESSGIRGNFNTAFIIEPMIAEQLCFVDLVCGIPVRSGNQHPPIRAHDAGSCGGLGHAPAARANRQGSPGRSADRGAVAWARDNGGRTGSISGSDHRLHGWRGPRIQAAEAVRRHGGSGGTARPQVATAAAYA